MRSAIALDDQRVVDGDERRAVVEVLDRVAAVAHDVLDQAVGVDDRDCRIVDELGLRALPGIHEALAGQRRERPELELSWRLLAVAQLGLGGAAIAGAIDGAVVLGPEALAQALGSAPADGRGQDQYGDDDDGDDEMIHSQVDTAASSDESVD